MGAGVICVSGEKEETGGGSSAGRLLSGNCSAPCSSDGTVFDVNSRSLHRDTSAQPPPNLRSAQMSTGGTHSMAFGVPIHVSSYTYRRIYCTTTRLRDPDWTECDSK